MPPARALYHRCARSLTHSCAFGSPVERARMRHVAVRTQWGPAPSMCGSSHGITPSSLSRRVAHQRGPSTVDCIGHSLLVYAGQRRAFKACNN
eukprot:38102-Pyramimonas_sp.AAC.1